MAQMFRIVTTWSGFNGGPGYTNHFFRNVLPGGAPSGVDERVSALAASERVVNFWRALEGYIPDDVRLNVSSVVDILEDTNGELQDSINIDPIPVIEGKSIGTYAAASGAVIGWSTRTVRNGRRIRGRTFIVPLAGARYTTSGRIEAEVVQTMQSAANSLAIGGINSTFGVWARPSSPTATDGQWAEATGTKVTDLPAILRSRRD